MNQSGKDISYTATPAETDFDSSLNFSLYAGGNEDLLTRTELITEMSSGVSDLTVTLSNETGSTASALYNW